MRCSNALQSSLFLAQSIPAIRPSIPQGVSAVRFRSDLFELEKNGDTVAKQQLARKCNAAVAELDVLKKFQETYGANLMEYVREYTDTELSALTRGKAVTDAGRIDRAQGMRQAV